MRIVKSLLPALSLAILFSTLITSQSYAATPDRITSAIDSSQIVELKGHVSPWARPQFDQGPVEPARTMYVTMLFAPTAQQRQGLEKLLADQQDETSPKYHQWLTAEQYGQQFGLSQGDLDKISAWLQAQGFKITYVAKGQDFLSFKGTAAQVESALRTEIRNYNVKGKMHFANVTPPSIPAALGGVIAGFRGLHDFFPHPMLKPHPNYTFTVSGSTFTALAPGDLATIYNINPSGYNSSNDGTGQSVVIAGQSDVYLADLVNYRTAFSISTISGCTLDATQTILQAGACSSGNFQVVWPNGNDPGLSPGDLGESDLDIETISAVARGAKIIFVTSAAGVDDSASWAIDHQLAPVISYSYGLCEAFVTAPGITAGESEYMKADALGISFFAASGDASSATCDGEAGGYPAILGPSVSYPASSPYLTGVGGTEFNENGGSYWNASNGSDGGSAKGYIPELAWNDTASAGTEDGTGGGPSNCASGSNNTTVGGFEFRICNAPPAGGFPKPSWQVGVTPNDGVRDVPDISFSASNFNDPYIVCMPQSEIPGDANVSTSSCVSGITTALATYNSAFGGTSASTPLAAAMTVLLNQSLGANGLGLLNPQLYKLYGTNFSAFHDIVGGTSSATGDTSDDIVACTVGTPGGANFPGWPTALQCPASGFIGYSAGTGYDLVTGLGSINVNALFLAWPNSRTTSTTTVSPSATSVTAPNSVTFTATVTPSTGTGTVSFSTVNNSVTTVLGSALVNLPYPTATTGTATLTVATGSSAGDLPGGSNSVTATYEGDGSNKVSTSAAVVVTVLAPDFSFIAAPTSTSVVSGHTSSAVTLTITPINGYNQPTTFSCIGLPTGATCAFSPNGGTTFFTSSQMTITTAASMGVTSTGITISATGSGQTHTMPFTLTTTATDQTFSLSATSTITVKQGNQGSAPITLAGTNQFNTPVTFSCSVPAAASEAQCTMAPATPTTLTSVTLNVTTMAPSRAQAAPFGRGLRIFYAALLPGLLGIVFTAGSRKRSLRGLRLLGLIFLLSFSTLWLGSCSGSNGGGTHNAGTPPGTYSITVSATTGGAVPVTNSNSTFAVSLMVTQ